MSAIPERGYGSWRQWKRRTLREEVAHVGILDGIQGEVDDWTKLHLAALPKGMEQMNASVRDATEAQA